MSQRKILILLRHAHRDTENPGADNGLSQKGRKQVESLVKEFHGRFKEDWKGSRTIFLSSPKRRCQETVQPIAEREGEGIQIDPLLTEVHPLETQEAFQARMDEFIRTWRKSSFEITIACSHGDWIPRCVDRLTGARIGIKKAGWCEISVEGHECYLIGLIQRA